VTLMKEVVCAVGNNFDHMLVICKVFVISSTDRNGLRDLLFAPTYRNPWNQRKSVELDNSLILIFLI
jgi:hypothetical protein